MEYVDGNRNMKYRNYDFEIISLIDSPNKTEDEESKSVEDKKLPLAGTNTSSAAPVTSHTGHNSLVTSHTGHNSLVTSHTGYTSPVTSHTGYTSPVTSHTGYTSPVTSHTGHNSPLKPHHNTKQLQPLTFHFTANTDLQDGCIWRRKIKTEEIRNVFSPQLQGPVGYGDVQPILDPALIPYFQRCHDQTEYPPIVITPIDYQSYHVIDPRKAEVGLDSGGATQSAEQLGLEEYCHILPPGVSTQKVCQVSKLSGYQGNGVKSGNHGNSSKTINPNHAGRPCNHGAGVTPGNHDNPPFKIKEEAPQEGVDSGRGSQTCSTVTTPLRTTDVTNKANRPHECPECGKLFKKIGFLKNHVRTHHECPKCGKLFKKIGFLKNHVRTHLTREDKDQSVVRSQRKTHARSSHGRNGIYQHNGDQHGYYCHGEKSQILSTELLDLEEDCHTLPPWVSTSQPPGVSTSQYTQPSEVSTSQPPGVSTSQPPGVSTSQYTQPPEVSTSQPPGVSTSQPPGVSTSQYTQPPGVSTSQYTQPPGVSTSQYTQPPGVSTQKGQVGKLPGYQGNREKAGNLGNRGKTINPNHAGRPCNHDNRGMPCNHGAGITPGNHDNPPFKVPQSEGSPGGCGQWERISDM